MATTICLYHSLRAQIAERQLLNPGDSRRVLTASFISSPEMIVHSARIRVLKISESLADSESNTTRRLNEVRQ